MKLIRKNPNPITPYCLFGTWYDEEDKFLCFTVERPWLDNKPDVSCLPAIPTIFSAYESPKHGQVWLAQNTSPRVGCEVHNANFWFQLEGCIGVGSEIAPLEYNGDEYPEYTGQTFQAVLNSVDTLNMLRMRLPETFSLDISYEN